MRQQIPFFDVGQPADKTRAQRNIAAASTTCHISFLLGLPNKRDTLVKLAAFRIQSPYDFWKINNLVFFWYTVKNCLGY
jgi:hypothetical protein